jgi:hypothetical protein
MKKLRRVGIVTMFFVLPFTALGAITDSDKATIRFKIDIIETAVDNGSAEEIIAMLSPNAPPTLASAIRNSVEGNSISFNQDITKYEEIAANTVRAKGAFSAEGFNWDIRGFSNEYVFENIEGEWLLLETEFHTRLGGAYILKAFGAVFIAFGVLFVFGGIFWLWMLIDLINRPIEHKTMWVLIVLFLSFLGAILYFFIARRRHKKDIEAFNVTNQVSSQSR